MKKLFPLLFMLFLIVSCATAPPHRSEEYEELSRKYGDSDFASIDRYMLSLKGRDEKSLDTLSAAIDRVAQTDWEKVRAVYIWITHNIRYDAKGYFAGDYGSNKAVDVLSDRTSVCSGYSNLFSALCGQLGLEVRTVTGYGKGVSYASGLAPAGTNHAWNIVTIDGEDHIFDATWGAGALWGNRFRFRYKEFYFDANPDMIIFTHFPSHDEDQLLVDPLSRELFFRLPNIQSTMFENGFDGSPYLERARGGEIITYPKIYSCRVPYEIYDFPVTSTLEAGREYHFLLRSKSSSKLIIKNGVDHYSYGSHDGGFYEVNQKFRKGTITLYLYSGSSGSGVMKYEVE